VCVGTLVHHEQHRQVEVNRIQRVSRDAASGQGGGGCGECIREHRYTMSKQSVELNRERRVRP